MGNRKGGITFLSINGVRYPCKGDVEYNLGTPKRNDVIGHDGVHGYSDEPVAAMCKTIITDYTELDVDALLRIDNATIVLELANSKVVTFVDAWEAGEKTINTKEGEIAVDFHARYASETAG